MIFQISPFVTSRLNGDSNSSWAVLLFCLFTVYFGCALVAPTIGKAAAGVLLLVGLCGLCRFKKQHYVLLQAERWLLFSFALFSVVSIISFFYWPQSRESRLHLEDYVTFIMLLPLYLLLRQFKFNFVALLILLALVAMLLGVVSITQYMAMKYFQLDIFDYRSNWLKKLRPSAGVNPMRYAAISLTLAVFPLIAMLVIRNKTYICKVLLVLASLLGFVACFLTQSRGALLSMPVLACVFGIYLLRAGHPRFLLILIAGSVAILGLASKQERVQGTFDSYDRYIQGDSKSALGARFDMFKAAGILIRQNPIFGHGLNSYSPKATKIRKDTPGMSREVGRWANPHNEILLVMVEKGFIGLITLLLLFAAPGYFFIRALHEAGDSVIGQQIRFYAMSGVSLLIIYAVAGQSVALFEHDVFNHFFALVVLLFASQIRVAGYMEQRAVGEG